MSLFANFTPAAFFAQVLLGLINGAFYALLSLGLAIIFGLLNVINFAHGVQYMLGGMLAWLLLVNFGVNYWGALLLAPALVGLGSMVVERVFLRRIYSVDHLYGFLLTFGIALVVQGLMQQRFGSVPQVYGMPDLLQGGINLGFMYLPIYRAWVIGFAVFVCLATWVLIEKSAIGARLRAATENASLVRSFGIRVPRLITVVYGLASALAAMAGVLAAPIYQVSPVMGADIMITVFAVVVIGGMGSLFGSVIAGFLLGFTEGLTKYFYPEASSVVIFIVMTLILLVRPSGLFGREIGKGPIQAHLADSVEETRLSWIWVASLIAITCILPFLVYPVFVMKALCFGLFACGFNLLLGRVGLLSFGHAAFFGWAAYVTGALLKNTSVTTEIAVLCGAAAAAALGLIFGLIAIRRRGIYLAMITLALSQVVYFYALKAKWTGGDDGLPEIPRGRLFGLISLDNTTALYIFVLAIFWLGVLIYYRTIRSPFGQVLRMIRDNEPRSISLGYEVNRYKLLAFVISAGLSGLAGATKVLVFQLASLTDLYWTMSGEVVLMTLVGGLGTILGPVFGAMTMIAIESYLAEMGSWVTVTQGIIFMACVLMLRHGIYGQLLILWRNRFGAGGAGQPAEIRQDAADTGSRLKTAICAGGDK
jgi:branched-chain amino acid transport system permease protein